MTFGSLGSRRFFQTFCLEAAGALTFLSLPLTTIFGSALPSRVKNCIFSNPWAAADLSGGKNLRLPLILGKKIPLTDWMNNDPLLAWFSISEMYEKSRAVQAWLDANYLSNGGMAGKSW